MSESSSRKTFPRISHAPANDSIATSTALFNDLNELFQFTYDPCPLGGHEKPGTPDGLTASFGARTFMNPPYSDLCAWLGHAYNQYHNYGAQSVVLVPHHAETLYWYNYVVTGATQIWQCITGLRFEGYKTKFSQPMCLVLYGDFCEQMPDRNTGDVIALGENLWYVLLLPAGVTSQRMRHHLGFTCADDVHIKKG